MFYWIECTIKYTKSYFISRFVCNIAHAILLKSHIQLENNLCAFCWYPARESKICWRLFSETYLTLAVEDNLRWDKSIVIRGLVKTFQSETVFFLGYYDFSGSPLFWKNSKIFPFFNYDASPKNELCNCTQVDSPRGK